MTITLQGPRAEWPVGGYLIEEEDRQELRMHAAPEFSLEGTYSAPTRIDPRTWDVPHPIENQKDQGACAGHSLSSCLEYVRRIAYPEEQWFQYSRAFGYYMAQKVDGITGDRGSTIHGGVKVATQTGLPPESVCPYPNSYNPRVVTQDAIEAAAEHKIRSYHWLKNYQQVFEYLAAGVGAVHTGMSWRQSMNSRNGVIETFTGRAGGGHSVAVLGYTERKDRNGRNYLLSPNSWGTGYGDKGWAEWAPAAVDGMLTERNTVFVGLTDLTVPRARPLDWTENSIGRL